MSPSLDVYVTGDLDFILNFFFFFLFESTPTVKEETGYLGMVLS